MMEVEKDMMNFHLRSHQRGQQGKMEMEVMRSLPMVFRKERNSTALIQGGAGDRTSRDGNRRGDCKRWGRRTVWKRAESDTSDLLYQPERDAAGNITGQEPVSRIEPQILKAEQIPEKIPMSLSNLSVNEEDERFQVKLEDCDLSDETSESFLFLKAQTEEILGRNGYEVPVTAGGIRSLEDVRSIAGE